MCYLSYMSLLKYIIQIIIKNQSKIQTRKKPQFKMTVVLKNIILI